MVPWRERKLSKGDHNEEEVDEDREEDGNSPEGVTGLKQLPREEEVGEGVHGGQGNAKGKNFANEEYVSYLHSSVGQLLLLKPNISITF